MRHFLAAIAWSTLLATPAFAEPDRRVWNLSAFEGRMILSFSQPETDNVFITFSCSEGSGIVTVVFGASSDKVTAGETLDFVLKVGATTANLRGGASQNLLDGVPSLNGSLGASDPVFTALATGTGTLTVAFKGEMRSVSLGSMRSQGRDFNTKCKA